MIKSALEYIVGMKKPEIMKIDGQTYSDKTLDRISYIPRSKPLELTTLSSLVKYMKSGIDKMGDKIFIHIVSPTEIRLISQLDDERERETLACVTPEIPHIDYNKYLEHENFCIALQSKFIENDDRNKLLRFAGTVENGTIAQYSDDGISQQATVKKGIASKSTELVPNPVTLKPYRTFTEVEQPESQFIFRMLDVNGISCAIFEADGGAWREKAMENIEKYLEKHLIGKIALVTQICIIR